jgi:hypothetical protein
MACKVPDATQVLTITPGQDYSLISVKENPKAQPTCLKVKEFTKKFSQEEVMGWGNGVPIFWWYKTLEITGKDVVDKKFTIIASGRYCSADDYASIRAELTWLPKAKL